MGREFELKYTATADIHRALQAAFGPFQTVVMETTYFDTPDSRFSAGKMTLRLRRENDRTLCTLKTHLPDGSRGEWECAAENIAAGLAGLLDAGAPADAIHLADAGLIPVCGARFTRLVTQLPTADGIAELALDAGIVLGGGKEAPLCEVELEKKSGSDQAVLALASQIAEAYGLQVEPKSKFRRALNLAQGE